MLAHHPGTTLKMLGVLTSRGVAPAATPRTPSAHAGHLSVTVDSFALSQIQQKWNHAVVDPFFTQLPSLGIRILRSVRAECVHHLLVLFFTAELYSMVCAHPRLSCWILMELFPELGSYK